MTRLIRWGHIVAGPHRQAGRLAVLWFDGLCEPPRLHRTVVEPQGDCDGTRLVWVDGEPLPDELRAELVHDLACAEDDTGFAPRPVYYAGVLQPATEALC